MIGLCGIASMSSNPQRQHWVPQFYLRHFSAPPKNVGSEAQIWMFSRLDGDRDAHLVGIKNVAVERHLYSPVREDGSRNFEIEKRLAKLEGLMSLRWNDIASRYIDLAKDVTLKKVLALFMAVQMLRTKKALSDSLELHDTMVTLFDSLPKNNDGNPKMELLAEPYSKTDPASWSEFKNPTSERLQQSFAEQIFPVGFDLVDHLLAKRWSIVAAKESVFMTSDCPVVMNHPYKEKFGIRTKRTMITFPLSPTRMLLLDDDLSRPPNRYWKLKPGGQHWFNLMTWVKCDRFVYAPFDPVIAIEDAGVEVESKFDQEAVERRCNPSRFKTGRNDPCHCGSGEKWKKCCGKL